MLDNANINKGYIQWLHSHKPAFSAKGHLLAAALMWSGAGLILFIIAGYYLIPLAGNWIQVSLIIITAVIVGFLKGRFVLGKMALKNVRRILSWKGEARCIGGFQPLRSWVLIIAMIFLGRMLRTSPLPRAIVSWVYIAVGTALFTGSRRFWTSLVTLGSLNTPGP